MRRSTSTLARTAISGFGALCNSGGFSPAMLPQPGSAAIDFGRNPLSTTTDQRGVAPVDGDGNGNGTLRADVGAVEAPAIAALPPTPPGDPAPAQPSHTS